MKRYLEIPNLLRRLKRRFVQRYALVHKRREFYHRRRHYQSGDRLKVAVLYYVPASSPKASCWRDGFTVALNILGKGHCDVDMVNLALGSPAASLLNSYDFLIVKSTWGWRPDEFFRALSAQITVARGLMISGSTEPPPLLRMLDYDVLWYETPWYASKVKSHPSVFHGFGVDTSAMAAQRGADSKYDYDWISVGAFTAHKRLDLLKAKTGRRLAIGESHYADSMQIMAELEESGIEIRTFVKYEELAALLRRSRAMYVPACLQGGGERAVMEARACGLLVEVEADNPKLLGLLDSPIWDAQYYAARLEEGIMSTISSAGGIPRTQR